MINFCMAAKEFQKYGELSTAMILVCIFQFIYVADCLFYEVSKCKNGYCKVTWCSQYI